MLKRLLIRWEEKKQKVAQAEQDRLEKDKASCIAEHNHVFNDMVSSPCAINNFRDCSSDCVHFNEGNPSIFFDWGSLGGKQYNYKPPSCRLWK